MISIFNNIECNKVKGFNCICGKYRYFTYWALHHCFMFFVRMTDLRTSYNWSFIVVIVIQIIGIKKNIKLIQNHWSDDICHIVFTKYLLLISRHNYFCGEVLTNITSIDKLSLLIKCNVVTSILENLNL